MFAPPVAKAQTKLAESSNSRLAPQRSTLAERRHRLQRTMGNQALLRRLGNAASALSSSPVQMSRKCADCEAAASNTVMQAKSAGTPRAAGGAPLIGVRFVSGQTDAAPAMRENGATPSGAAPAGSPAPDAVPAQAENAAADAAAAGQTAAGAGTGANCADGAVDQTQDALPAVPPYTYQLVSGPALFDAVKQREPGTTEHPLGASYPAFDQGAPLPVKVTTTPDTGNNCLKCIADWTLPAFTWVSYVANNYVVSDEPKRFPAIRADDVTGCPASAVPHLTEVRIQIPAALMPKIAAGEGEHYADWVRAYQMAGGRLLGNTRRLTPERTHLRGSDQAACEAKVADFLAVASGSEPTATLAQNLKLSVTEVQHVILANYGDKLFPQDVNLVYAQSGNARDVKGGPHHAKDPAPPLSQTPILPNIDTSINPFGCDAYARRHSAQSLPGIPGADAKAVVTDLDIPIKQPWHAL